METALTTDRKTLYSIRVDLFLGLLFLHPPLEPRVLPRRRCARNRSLSMPALPGTVRVGASRANATCASLRKRSARQISFFAIPEQKIREARIRAWEKPENSQQPPHRLSCRCCFCSGYKKRRPQERASSRKVFVGGIRDSRKLSISLQKQRTDKKREGERRLEIESTLQTDEISYLHFSLQTATHFSFQSDLCWWDRRQDDSQSPTGPLCKQFFSNRNNSPCRKEDQTSKDGGTCYGDH